MLWGGGHIDRHKWRRVNTGFGAICSVRILSLPCDLLHDNLYACVIQSTQERQLMLALQAYLQQNLEIQKSPPYLTARWPTQQISSLNFLGLFFFLS